jgi:hypothetical protein
MNANDRTVLEEMERVLAQLQAVKSYDYSNAYYAALARTRYMRPAADSFHNGVERDFLHGKLLALDTVVTSWGKAA